MGLPSWLSGKEPAYQWRRHRIHGFDPWVREIPWRNGNPLQYSCLGNPMDGGAWQAAVHGVAKEWGTTERLTLSLSSVSYFRFNI